MEQSSLPKGRLFLSPEEKFSVQMSERIISLVGADKEVNLTREHVRQLLEYIRELIDYAEDFPDEPPVQDAEVDECFADLECDGEGPGTALVLNQICFSPSLLTVLEFVPQIL
jgi:hypothetical protein